MPTLTFGFSDIVPLTIPVSGTVSRPFSLSGLGTWGRVIDISVTLGGLSHTFPDDLDFLFLGPGGRNLEFWSDAGGLTDIVNGTYTIRDSGALFLPDAVGIPPGTYKPTDYNSGDLEDGAHWGLSPSITINHPAGSTPSGATFASAFGGVWVDNSTWSLYVTDDAGGDSGSLAQWGFVITYNQIVKPDDFNSNGLSDIL